MNSSNVRRMLRIKTLRVGCGRKNVPRETLLVSTIAQAFLRMRARVLAYARRAYAFFFQMNLIPVCVRIRLALRVCSFSLSLSLARWIFFSLSRAGFFFLSISLSRLSLIYDNKKREHITLGMRKIFTKQYSFLSGRNALFAYGALCVFRENA